MVPSQGDPVWCGVADCKAEYIFRRNSFKDSLLQLCFIERVDFRRSSRKLNMSGRMGKVPGIIHSCPVSNGIVLPDRGFLYHDFILRDRKSTRLNSSHVAISYAV